MNVLLPEPQFSMPMKVRDYEADAEGIVNNAVYLHYFEHTRHEFCASAGLSFRQMRQMGMAPVVREINVTYVHSLGLGESMTSNLALTREGARFIFRQWIVNESGQLVTDATITVVNMLHGRPTRGEEFARVFAPYLN